MKLLPILFFFSYFILCAAVLVADTGVDCDDPDIFKAVDAALRNYNEAKEDGNQFILLRVTDAKQRNDANGEIHYFVEYEIREGSCPVKSMHSWQDCQFQENKPEWGNCSAHLRINKEEKIQTVESQNCHISKVALESPVTAMHHQCLGCPYPVDKNSEEILRYVHIAIEKMNRQGSHLYFFDLDYIENANSQVVSGWDYNIHYVVRKTNCSKIDFKTKDSNGCIVEKEGETGDCGIQVSITPKGDVNEISVKCTSQAGVCLSCPLKVDPNDPELQNLISQVIDEYNSNENVTNLHKFDSVVTATKYGFQEQIYEVLFTMIPTTCTKPEHSILGDGCDNLENVFPLACEITIRVTDKRMNVDSAPECVLQRALPLLKRIAGLSPLRMLQKSNQTEDNPELSADKMDQEQSKGKKKGHDKGHKHEQKGKSDKKQREHKHDHKKMVESGISLDVKEDSHQVPDLPGAQPNIPSTEAAPKDVNETPKQEIPDVPKCPGKHWQPKRLTTVKPLTDDDLAFALDESTSLQEKEEQSKPYTPKQIPFFDDDDLLI